MTACNACLHYPHCMERRGICTEYKTLEMIRREINALNENQKASPTVTADSHKDDTQ